MSYTLSQWIIFFFIYSLIGWIWECCLVSIREKRWVNRGFLNGTILPIYGFGAVTILLSTIKVQNSIPLIFIMGMAGADILEYFTGAVMYRLFHVKYWDYTRFKFNLNGYISLQSSLCWGVFSVILVKIIHVPIADAINTIKPYIAEIMAIGMTSAFAIDFAVSLREALDLKSILIYLDDSKEQIERLQKRLEVISAVVMDDYHNFMKKAEDGDNIRSVRQKIEAMRNVRLEQIKQLYSKLEDEADIRSDYSEIKQMIQREMKNFDDRKNVMYERAIRHLKRNPGAISLKHRGPIEEIKKVLEERKSRK